MEELEREARETKKCLWADPQTVPPWEWRKMTQFVSKQQILPARIPRLPQKTF